jgi:hypothetical protein
LTAGSTTVARSPFDVQEVSMTEEELSELKERLAEARAEVERLEAMAADRAHRAASLSREKSEPWCER